MHSNVMYKNGWKLIAISIHVVNIIFEKMQAKNLLKYYFICQNTFQ
jgi:hypothetical protein